MRKSFPRDEKRAASIGIEDFVPLIESETFKRGGSEDCGVVDEDVETAELGCSCAYSGSDGRFGAHIAFNDSSVATDCGDIRRGLRGFCAGHSV